MTKEKNNKTVIDVGQILSQRTLDKQEQEAMRAAEGEDYELVFNGEVLRLLKEMEKTMNGLRLTNVEMSNKLAETIEKVEDNSTMLNRMLTVNSNMAKEVDKLNERIYELERDNVEGSEE